MSGQSAAAPPDEHMVCICGEPVTNHPPDHPPTMVAPDPYWAEPVGEQLPAELWISDHISTTGVYCAWDSASEDPEVPKFRYVRAVKQPPAEPDIEGTEEGGGSC